MEVDLDLSSNSEDLTITVPKSTLSAEDEVGADVSGLLKKNSKRKLCKRLVLEKVHVHNSSRKPYKVVVPRVLSTDIRKQYGIMFLNLMNHASAQFVELFFSKFASKNFCVENVLLPRPSSNPRITMGHQARFEVPQTHHFTNPHEFVRFFEGISESVPDRVLTMKSAVLITRSNTFKTEIIVDFKVVGTKIFDIDTVEMATVISNMKEKLGGVENITRDEVVKVMAENFTPPAPKPLVGDGRFVIIINDYRDSCKIDKIVVEGCPTQD